MRWELRACPEGKGRMTKIVEEFKTFAVKGNAVDMAVGILLGLAFNKVVNSLVNDILMPATGYLVSNVEFKHLKWVIRPERASATGEILPEVAIGYGIFINTVIEFLIIAFSLFLVVKVMNRIIRKRQEEISG